MRNIEIIYNALLNRNEKIFHKSKIVELIKEYKKKFKSSIDVDNTVKYLSRHRYIKRIFQSYYYINSIDERKRKYCMYEDRELLFIVLNKLRVKWYLGLSNARYCLGEVWQVPATLTIINNKFSGKKKIDGMRVKFIKIKGKLIFGLKSKNTKNKVKFYYSDLQKTNLDFLYFKLTKKVHWDKKTKEYVRKFPKWLLKK